MDPVRSARQEHMETMDTMLAQQGTGNARLYAMFAEHEEKIHQLHMMVRQLSTEILKNTETLTQHSLTAEDLKSQIKDLESQVSVRDNTIDRLRQQLLQQPSKEEAVLVDSDSLKMETYTPKAEIPTQKEINQVELTSMPHQIVPAEERRNKARCRLKTGKKPMGVNVGDDTLIVNGISVEKPSSSFSYQVEAGKPFSYTWRLENQSVNPWPPGTRLVPVGVNNNLLGASERMDIDEGDLAKPGYYSEITHNFVAPNEPGVYMSYWRLSDNRGTKFGERLRVKIHVTLPKGVIQAVLHNETYWSAA